MVEIDTYRFGRMSIDGRDYTKDLIIYPDGTIRENWWRQAGHSLVVEDIRDLLDAGPETIVVGTGGSGMMRVSADLVNLLEKSGIELVAEPTSRAMETFNRLRHKKKVGGCFHLTC